MSTDDSAMPANDSTSEPIEAEAPGAARQAALERLLQRIRCEQNLMLGIAGGLAGAIVAAIAWALITAITHFQIGYMALGVGFVVGYGVRMLGRGIDRPFRVVGAAFAVLGCALGNVGAIVVEVANAKHAAVTDILAQLDPAKAWYLLSVEFKPMDIIFYGFAVYCGWKYSLRVLTPEEIATIPS